MIRQVNSILFVKDQAASTAFFRSLLRKDPVLDVPGMTEFEVSERHILGLMPAPGAKNLLQTEVGGDIPTGEIYFVVDDASAWHQRALELGAIEISAVLPRNWGDTAGYSSTIDGHILAFAQRDLPTSAI